MRNADVIIVGGGVIGLMTGWRLARARARVLLVDKGAPAATNAAAGMLAPSFERTLHRAGAALAEFSVQSLRRWAEIAPEIEAQSGRAIDYDASGILSVAFDDAGLAALAAEKDGGEMLCAREALALEAGLSPAIIGAKFVRGEGQVDPRLLLVALDRAFARAGGVIRRGADAVSIAEAGGRARGVRLASGQTLNAPTIVIATGARIAGLVALPEGALFPVKGEALAVSRVEGSPSHVVRSDHAYLCPKASGRIIIGASEAPRDWSLLPDGARVDALRAGGEATCPALSTAREIERWAGLRPATRDGAPLIGAAPEGPDGVFCALGHYRNGVLLAPATADALAETITGAGVSQALSDFAPRRFLV